VERTCTDAISYWKAVANHLRDGTSSTFNLLPRKRFFLEIPPQNFSMSLFVRCNQGNAYKCKYLICKKSKDTVIDSCFVDTFSIDDTLLKILDNCMCLLDGGIDGFIAADLPVNEEVKAAIKGYSVDIVSFVEQIFSLPSYQVMLTNLVKDFDNTTRNDDLDDGDYDDNNASDADNDDDDDDNDDDYDLEDNDDEDEDNNEDDDDDDDSRNDEMGQGKKRKNTSNEKGTSKSKKSRRVVNADELDELLDSTQMKLYYLYLLFLDDDFVKVLANNNPTKK